MVFWIASAVGLAIAYLLGSTPSGYLAGRMLRGIDIREHGSKSTGATNVLRTLGKWPALAVLLVDILKGVAAIVFARWFYPWCYTISSIAPPTALELQIWVPWAVCIAGLAVLFGHGRSVWLNFTGGKSAATGLGVLLAMSWPVGLVATAAFAASLALFRIVSLSSILAALTAVTLVCGLEQPLPYRLLVIAGSLYVILRHRANIQRLRAGTEPRLGHSSPGQGAARP
ncbi:glycerol-3-phosphate acyltransferase [Mesorhizobium sp. M2D.F.Ca.ET.223.01.1.1]|uniref:glycerol-3-phosphate 1-O-acyltransferase PlsY n=1 Tax=Mesorhizobium sp. M2D.F.Ca.ET.223.01.1.1 TaxID=2563940 RepID=UPI00109273BB|nr:glycerol-3-phosphate 1-O-acyltransferase PlsY [Mesorhizobium sp. M2D.F.Ca.ET.223.01.1.1]TGR81226.1 glycerol-3-phosphate acyltransferase [Mesorhizobium sp. M2D.F.Ca.ET.223.01.1.1]TGT73229.1 glycerol-3-phosphate acyltransferase [bacterium M00.F.Ca.ET.159.01.1.1]TGT84108.1 glycerol-3-phosphate acyltransferase [bacterium M00.F.Ca.ET.157.01.1.1]